MKVYICFFVLIAAFIVEAVNNRPIIGILDQKYNSEHSYIAASYVKWIESAGARVVPLFYERWSTKTMENMLKNLNGVVFPGGSQSFSGKYLEQLNTIFDYAKKANDNGIYFPLWGTCQGHEELLILAANDTSVLDHDFESDDVSLSLKLTSSADESRLFKAMPEKLKTIVTSQDVTYNHHKGGITPNKFNNCKKLADFYRPLSTNVDKKGKTFISTMEGKKYPFYGTQWHPEKAEFEWKEDKKFNHSGDSIELNSWMSRFFVSECRKNNIHFSDTSSETKALIYQYEPTYYSDGYFVQSYVFPK